MPSSRPGTPARSRRHLRSSGSTPAPRFSSSTQHTTPRISWASPSWAGSVTFKFLARFARMLFQLIFALFCCSNLLLARVSYFPKNSNPNFCFLGRLYKCRSATFRARRKSSRRWPRANSRRSRTRCGNFDIILDHLLKSQRIWWLANHC